MYSHSVYHNEYDRFQFNVVYLLFPTFCMKFIASCIPCFHVIGWRACFRKSGQKQRISEGNPRTISSVRTPAKKCFSESVTWYEWTVQYWTISRGQLYECYITGRPGGIFSGKWPNLMNVRTAELWSQLHEIRLEIGSLPLYFLQMIEF